MWMGLLAQWLSQVNGVIDSVGAIGEWDHSWMGVISLIGVIRLKGVIGESGHLQRGIIGLISVIGSMVIIGEVGNSRMWGHSGFSR